VLPVSTPPSRPEVSTKAASAVPRFTTNPECGLGRNLGHPLNYLPEGR
jgi:hypothetical protein